MGQEVKELAVFLKSVKDPKGSLLIDLLHTICESFPAELTSDKMKKNVVSVSCPCNVIHQVTSFGFALLEQAETAVRGNHAKPKQKLIGLFIGVWGFTGFGSNEEHIEELISRTLRQKQKVAKIVVYIMTNSNDGTCRKATEVCLKLIQNCKSWRIGSLLFSRLTFEDHCNSLLEGLAKQASRGAIGNMLINDPCIAHSKIDQLKRIWNITETAWQIKTFLPDILMRRDEWRWTRVLGVIKTIQQVMHLQNCGEDCHCVKS